MSKWITTIGPILQTNIPNKVRTYNNQILYDSKDKIYYLVPRKLITDNYSIPLGINKSKWDVRPSHLHDIGCYYHQVIKINLTRRELEDYLIKIDTYNGDIIICKDIPIQYLEVIDIGFNKCNSLLKVGMKASNIPSYICNLYRLGVNFNINWLCTGKSNIKLDNIYSKDMETCKWMT